MLYLDELRMKVAQAFGKSISTRKDAQGLCDAIVRQQKKYLSESTIRRFFNLIPSVETSKTTADIFAQYIGFADYDHFCEYQNSLVFNTVKNQTDLAVLNGLKNKTSLSVLELNLICSRILALLKSGDFELVITYFSNDALYKAVSSNQNINDLFGQTLGAYFFENDINMDVDTLMATPYFIPLVLYHYVDVCNPRFECYYLWMIKHHTNHHDLVFPASVMALRHVYENRLDRAREFFSLIEHVPNDFATILQGRVALLHYVFDPNIKVLLQKAEAFRKDIFWFSVEILYYFIYTKNSDDMKTYLSHFPEMKEKNISFVETEFMDILEMSKFIAKQDEKGLIDFVKYKKEMINSNSIMKKIEERIMTLENSVKTK